MSVLCEWWLRGLLSQLLLGDCGLAGFEDLRVEGRRQAVHLICLLQPLVYNGCNKSIVSATVIVIRSTGYRICNRF